MSSHLEHLDTTKLYRHRRRNTVYRILHFGTFQSSSSDGIELDDQLCVVYQDINDFKIWIRAVHEFSDGRFLIVNGE